MACLLSISFSTPLRTPPILLQEVHPRKLSLNRLLSQANARTAPTFLAICNIANKGIFSVNRIYRHHFLTPTRCRSEIDSCPGNVGSCTNYMVIAGYWVGPDLDDGWGFVEAFIYQIT